MCLVLKATPSEVFNNLDEQEICSVAYRLQDEKQQRLLIQNDVEVMMLKIGVLERSLGELKQSQSKYASNFKYRHTVMRCRTSCHQDNLSCR